jgi:8-oxo-dGTP diphosphatase
MNADTKKTRTAPKATPETIKDEQAFLDTYDPKGFDRPSVTVDVALITVNDGKINTLLVQRDEHPDVGKWALPGTFVGMEENLEDSAFRVLRDKVSEVVFKREIYLEQLYTFGDTDRDPRTRVITVAYYALVDQARFEEAMAEGKALIARLVIPWEGETGGPVEAVDGEAAGGNPMELAFDHGSILGMAVKRMRGKLNYTPIGFQLLPEAFTLRQLQDVHETVLGRPLNKDSFRRRMLATEMLEATGRLEKDTAHRPAELYRFVKRAAV